MFQRTTLVAGAVVIAASLSSMAQADTVSLMGIANGDSRAFRAWQDAFAQIDRGYDFGGLVDPDIDGYFRISDEFNINNVEINTPDLFDFDPRLFNPTSFRQNLAPLSSSGVFSDVDVFPNEENFDLGDLTFDNASATGMGTETFDITAYTVEFFDSVQPITYETDLSLVGNANTVTFENGVLDSVTLTSNVSFIVDSGFGFNVQFDGSFSITDNAFDLLVDDTIVVPSTDDNPDGMIRLIVDSRGFVITPTVIPEPTSVFALAIGSVIAATRRRPKRQHFAS